MLDARMLKLALLKTECSCSRPYGLVCLSCAPRPDSRVVIHGAGCLNKCSEEGEAYLLDPNGKFGLRVKCRCAKNIQLAKAGEYTAGHFGGAICSSCYETYSASFSGGHSDSCLDCQGHNWTLSTDLTTWIEATAGLNLIVCLRNDGPGWRCDLRENQLYGKCLATGWSDGGGELDEPPKYKPYPLEAVVNALAILNGMRMQDVNN